MKPAGSRVIRVQEKAILVQVISGRTDRDAAADSLLELERLADTAGAVVAGSITQRRAAPTSQFFVGEGKLADIQLACRNAGANIVIFDNELSSVQVNNLDLALGIKVIDRTELILQIFAGRARSAEAQCQVELAQLEYLITRIPVSEKQSRFQGGIGMRGPGESPLQLRNAPMRRRIRDLRRKLEGIQRRREQKRPHPQWPTVCLVGYTNAGKSTMLNVLAHADAYVDDRLFATLDTKTRRIHLPNGVDALLTDTVGFIRNLPHGLVASFRSTLDVAVQADLLLVMVEAAHPWVEDHLRVVNGTLQEIGAAHVPSLLLLNKWDLVTDEAVRADLRSRFPEAFGISAATGEGLAAFKQVMGEKLADVVRRRNPDWQPR